VPEGVEPCEGAHLGREEVRPIQKEGHDEGTRQSMARVGGEPCPGEAVVSDEGKSSLS